MELLGFPYTSFVLKQPNTALLYLQRKGNMQRKKLYLPFPPVQETIINRLVNCLCCKSFGICLSLGVSN